MLLSTIKAQHGASPPEQELFAQANAARAAHGLAPLTWNPALVRAARTHVVYISREPGELSHTYPGEPGLLDRAIHAGAHFLTVSENLARGIATPAQLQQTWMNTAVHRANLLNPNLDAIGIAVLETNGTLFAVEDFALTVPALESPEIVQQVAFALRAQGLQSVTAPADDHGLCRDGKERTAHALLVVQSEGPDPPHLPDALLHQLAAKSYHSAVVAVCKAEQRNGVYRVTVFLH